MKNCLFLIAVLLSCKNRDSEKSPILKNVVSTEIKSGDIIFQTSISSQSEAIQLATNSKYSHLGIVFKNGNQLDVFEAVELVKLTPLNDWIARGKGGKYVVKRLKNADSLLSNDKLNLLEKVGRPFAGKHYDSQFGWDDDQIYCSELVWKMYKQALNIEIGSLQKLSDFDLKNPVVAKKLKERYGEKLPLDEPVISPAAMFESELLEVVVEN